MSSTDSSDSPEEWEVEYDKKVQEQQKQKNQNIVKSTPPQTKKVDLGQTSESGKKPTNAHAETRALNPKEIERQIIESERRIASDLFGADDSDDDSQKSGEGGELLEYGYSKTDRNAQSKTERIQEVEVIKNYKDMKTCLNEFLPKIRLSQATSFVWRKLITAILEECLPRLSQEDLTAIVRKVNEASEARALERNLAKTSARKINDTKSMMKNCKNLKNLALMDEDYDDSEFSEKSDDDLPASESSTNPIDAK